MSKEKKFIDPYSDAYASQPEIAQKDRHAFSKTGELRDENLTKSRQPRYDWAHRFAYRGEITHAPTTDIALIRSVLDTNRETFERPPLSQFAEPREKIIDAQDWRPGGQTMIVENDPAANITYPITGLGGYSTRPGEFAPGSDTMVMETDPAAGYTMGDLGREPISVRRALRVALLSSEPVTVIIPPVTGIRRRVVLLAGLKGLEAFDALLSGQRAMPSSLDIVKGLGRKRDAASYYSPVQSAANLVADAAQMVAGVAESPLLQVAEDAKGMDIAKQGAATILQQRLAEIEREQIQSDSELAILHNELDQMTSPGLAPIPGARSKAQIAKHFAQIVQRATAQMGTPDLYEYGIAQAVDSWAACMNEMIAEIGAEVSLLKVEALKTSESLAQVRDLG